MPAGLRGICRIAASYGDGSVVMDNGAAAGWTRLTIYNQVGFPDSLRNVVQTYSVGNATLLVMGHGRVFEIGQQTGGSLQEFPELNDIVEVAGAYDRILGRRRDGAVMVWEHFLNFSEQPISTNVPPEATNVISIAAGRAHYLALKAGGRVIAWGANNFGQCNVPESVISAVAITAGQNHSAALLADGSVICWGDGRNGQTNIPPGLRGVVSISALADETLALVDDDVKVGRPALVGPPAAVFTPGVPFELRLKSFHSPARATAEGLPTGLTFDPARQAIVGSSDVMGTFQVTLRSETSAGSTVRMLRACLRSDEC